MRYNFTQTKSFHLTTNLIASEPGYVVADAVLLVPGVHAGSRGPINYPARILRKRANGTAFPLPFIIPSATVGISLSLARRNTSSAIFLNLDIAAGVFAHAYTWTFPGLPTM